MNRYEAKINITDTIYKVFSTPLFTGDIGNTVHLEFFMRGKPYNASNANIYKLMADGKSASVAVAMKDNICEFTIPNIMHSNASESEIELQIALLDDIGNILTSGVLRFEVKEGLSDKAQIAGTDEYNDMTALLNQTAKAASAANEAADKAEQVIAALTSNKVLKYKNAVDTYENLPSKPYVGDVYNVRKAYKAKAYGVNVTGVKDEGFIINEDRVNIAKCYLKVDNPSLFGTGNKVMVFDENGHRIGGFVVQHSDSQSVYEDNENTQGLSVICNYLYDKHRTTLYTIPYDIDVNKMYYFVGIAETSDSIDVTLVNDGENVVWNGFEWDNLGGTVDLSGYATTQRVEDLEANVYTKSQIDSKISAVYKYKGSVSTYKDLPSSPSVGDVYNVANDCSWGPISAIVRVPSSYIKDWTYDSNQNLLCMQLSGFNLDLYPGFYYITATTSGEILFEEAEVRSFNRLESGVAEIICSCKLSDEYKSKPSGVMQIETREWVEIKAGDNVVWNGVIWDVLAGTVDLSSYSTTAQVSAMIESAIGTALEGEY